MMATPHGRWDTLTCWRSAGPSHARVRCALLGLLVEQRAVLGGKARARNPSRRASLSAGLGFGQTGRETPEKAGLRAWGVLGGSQHLLVMTRPHAAAESTAQTCRPGAAGQRRSIVI